MTPPVFVAMNAFLCESCARARAHGVALDHRESGDCLIAVWKQADAEGVSVASEDRKKHAERFETYICSACRETKSGLIEYRTTQMLPLCRECHEAGVDVELLKDAHA